DFKLERYKFLLQQINLLNENAHRQLTLYQSLATAVIGAGVLLFLKWREWKLDAADARLATRALLGLLGILTLFVVASIVVGVVSWLDFRREEAEFLHPSNPLHRLDGQGLLLAVAEDDNAHVAAGLDISYCCVDIGHRGCPAVVDRGQHVARLETGQRGRRARKNRNDWHAGRVDIASRLGQPEAPETPGNQHAAANRLGAGKATGKLPQQVANWKVNWLERHLVGLVIDCRAVAGKECEPDDPIDWTAERFAQDLEGGMVEDDHRQLRGRQVADLKLGDLGFAPHREEERPGRVGLDNPRGFAHLVAQQRDRRSEVEDQAVGTLAVDGSLNDHVVRGKHRERHHSLYSRLGRRRSLCRCLRTKACPGQAQPHTKQGRGSQEESESKDEDNSPGITLVHHLKSLPGGNCHGQLARLVLLVAAPESQLDGVAGLDGGQGGTGRFEGGYGLAAGADQAIAGLDISLRRR